ncbi:MAG TPA: hypothetical protein VH309_05400 [Elusimicrobiota bacterium]|jgi:hypothetical protein|nr:hypothetical protein [Elusimicrobiota bacterium]
MENKSKLLVVLAACAALAAPASAAVSVGAQQTFGTLNYRGTKANASIDVTDSLYLTPSFATYRTDESSGPLYQGGLRVGYEEGPLSLGVTGAFVPKADGYSQNSVGADLTFSLSPGHTRHGHRMAGPASQSNETFGYGLAGVDLGGSVNHITHKDDYGALGSGGEALRRQGAAFAKPFTVGETDLTAFAGAKFLFTEISASVSKSVYDKTLDGNNLRESPFMVMGEYAAIESGYPDSDYNIKVKWKTLPVVTPYVSFTHTNFKLGSAPSNATEAGVSVGLDMLNVRAAYGHYGQNGFDSRNYFNLGASLNFGS